MKLQIVFIFSAVCGWSSFSNAQATSAPANPLHRQYRAGEKLTYHMKGVNEAWHYEIDAEGVVKKDAAGQYFEEYQWVHMTSNGQPESLLPSAADYRQRLTLDPDQNPSAPDLTKVDPKMIGPITDMMTFYSDLWLANKLGVLKKARDHFYFKNPMPPSSWADGTHVLVGQDAIDFDMTLKSVDAAAGTAMVEVRHVPPQNPALPLKAAWMQDPVGTGANNWVQIAKDENGKYEAGVGMETFTVDITVSLADGHIASATMENPVITIERTCEDEALSKCGDAKRHEILRKIEMTTGQRSGN
ncbi:hypothetical protein ACFPT7_12225 [Acidicapsa dinghuensis]|uniref:DUF3108 domain-containing protein n=1 Tax=Acidicapsa dinghuensis TaxID=2218256 RepID=A0ABW1EI65_9BACT|nr:hypothetical protein [Acidicapsa dinghuensis]